MVTRGGRMAEARSHAPRRWHSLINFESRPTFALVTMHSCVPFDTQAVQNVEDLGRHDIIPPDSSQRASERVVVGDVCAGILGNDPSHALGKLPGLN